MPLLFTGCKDDDDTSKTESLVEVNPTGSGMPTGTVYYFYDEANGTFEKYDAAANGTFSRKLPFGEYAMLGTNTDASGVTFDGMDDFSSATVSAVIIPRPSRSTRAVLQQVGKVYSVGTESLTVEKGKTTTLTPDPQLLTQTITIGFNVAEDLLPDIASIAGGINGIHSTLNLATGAPTAEAIANSPSTAVTFNAGAVTRAGANMQGVICVLGIQKPSEELPNYTPVLNIDVVMKDDSYIALSVDLTETLAEGDLTEGNIDLPVTDVIRQGADLKATINDWTLSPNIDPNNNTGVKI